MKIILFTAALTLASAAVAQSGYTVSDVSQSRGKRGITQQGTDPEGTPCTPKGYNATAGVYPPCPDPPIVPSPPDCTKEVTDGCVQRYEKGVRR